MNMISKVWTERRGDECLVSGGWRVCVLNPRLLTWLIMENLLTKLPRSKVIWRQMISEWMESFVVLTMEKQQTETANIEVKGDIFLIFTFYRIYLLVISRKIIAWCSHRETVYCILKGGSNNSISLNSITAPLANWCHQAVESRVIYWRTIMGS